MLESVLITGGTGLIGKPLTKELVSKGYNVIILTRGESKPECNNVSYAHWNIETGEIDYSATGDPDYIIHLAGAGVMDKAWTAAYKKTIVDSRIKSSALLLKYLKQKTNKVKAIVSSSAIGWYGGDASSTYKKNGFIETDPPANDFLGDTCRLWEESISPARAAGIRVVNLRTGIVLSNEGGAFPEFKKSLQFGIASVLGSGIQVISWIHIHDLVEMYITAMTDANLTGPYNAVAPFPVTNKTLIIKTAERLKGKFYLPVHVPEFVLKLMMGQRSVEILKSTTVDSKKIQDAGFNFAYKTINEALDNLCTTTKILVKPAID